MLFGEIIKHVDGDREVYDVTIVNRCSAAGEYIKSGTLMNVSVNNLLKAIDDLRHDLGGGEITWKSS